MPLSQEQPPQAGSSGVGTSPDQEEEADRIQRILNELEEGSDRDQEEQKKDRSWNIGLREWKGLIKPRGTQEAVTLGLAMVAASMVSKSPDVKKITKAHADFVLGATMGRFHGRKIIKGVFSSEALGRALRTLFVAQEVVKSSLDPLLSRVVGEVDPNDPETTESFLGNLKQDFVFPREITGGLAVMNYQIADRQDEYAVGRVVGRVIDRKNAIF